MTRDLLDQPRSLERPLSPVCRVFGLAAVAAELNLQLDTLEPETAKAIERGAAALFLAGYGPRLTGYAGSHRLREKDRRASGAKRSLKVRYARLPQPRIDGRSLRGIEARVQERKRGIDS